jgi:hypothetical protein
MRGIVVVGEILLVDAFAEFEVELDARDGFELFAVLMDGASDETVLVEDEVAAEVGVTQDVEGLVDFGGGVEVLQLLFQSLSRHLAPVLDRGDVGKLLLLGVGLVFHLLF